MTKQEYAAGLFPDDLKAQADFCSQFDMGDEVEIDDNICQCEAYIIGDNRCKCGQVRITVEDYKNDGENIFIFNQC